MTGPGAMPHRSAIHAASALWQTRSCSGVIAAVSRAGVKISETAR